MSEKTDPNREIYPSAGWPADHTDSKTAQDLEKEHRLRKVTEKD